ncbi:hypothetical protein CEY02_20645 [Bacillus pumilus]|uniref:Uncharacterized protein n=1 Tax=Bacillus pumilus TaxID=1408 RepID=A0A2A5IDQ5_BACPU|nr:hypothetical protein [Bacillus pumilus]PCK15524.1 hypothetical protein CEY02_20645 [Bacillus pumilus]
MSKNNELWMVYEHELGLIGVYDNEDEANLAYERTKDNLNEDTQINENEIYGDERVILAKVKKDYHSFDTEELEMKENDNGIEEKSDATLWDFKEDTYK